MVKTVGIRRVIPPTNSLDVMGADSAVGGHTTHRDGVTNDSDHIAAALTAARTAGKVLYFPAGTYKLTSPITLQTNDRLQGANRLTTTLYQADTGASQCLSLSLQRNVLITDLGFSSDITPKATMRGIYMDRATNVTLRRLYFTGFAFGIKIDPGGTGNTNITLTDILSDNCRTAICAAYMTASTWSNLNITSYGGETGTCQAGGSTTTAVLSSGSSAVDDYYYAGVSTPTLQVRFLDQPTVWHNVTDYVGATHTVSFATSARATAPDGVGYQIGTNAGDHCVYIGYGITNSTFNNLTLAHGAGYCLQMYGASPANTNLTFNNLALDAYQMALVVGTGFSNTYINNISGTNNSGSFFSLGNTTSDLYVTGISCTGPGNMVGTGTGTNLNFTTGTYTGPGLGERTGVTITDVTLQNPPGSYAGTYYANIASAAVCSADLVWATAQAGSALTLASSANTYAYTGDWKGADTKYQLRQFFFWFNTTDVLLSHTIDDAQLYLGFGSADLPREADFDVEVYAGGAADTIATTDWKAAFGTLIAKTTITTAFSNYGTYIQLTAQGTALKDAIVKGGHTRLMVVTSLTRAGVAPTSHRNILTYTGAHATLRPKLTVAHTG